MIPICLAKTASLQISSSGEENPEGKNVVSLQCPSSIDGNCVTTARNWHCCKCLAKIEHASTGVFYCNCGSAPSHSYSFKCCSDRHGAKFTSFDDCYTDGVYFFGGRCSDVNILLLGETGVGKSTYINALVNYLAFPSLDDALQGNLLSLIYSKFTTCTEEDPEITVEVGEQDSNEGDGTQRVGESCTQTCRSYQFQVGNGPLVRLIDSPGIGDTRGFKHDVKNMKEIISFLSNYETIHSVCILLKPDEQRLTLSLKYCITQLLAHLHKDAAKNIVFCFTNSRSTRYRSGGSTKLLRALLAEEIEANLIRLEKDTMYFFDSESFRFLASARRGIAYDDEDKALYNGSWNQSAKESIRLLSYVSSLKPHSTERTLSVNRTKELVLMLEAPLTSMSFVIQKNVETLQKKRDEVRQYGISVEEQSKGLLTTRTKLEVESLGYYRTVCYAAKCLGTVCHERCSRDATGIKIYDATIGKWRCRAFNFGGICQKCRCPHERHTRVATKQVEVSYTTENEEVRKAINEQKNLMEITNVAIVALEVEEKHLKAEFDAVLHASAQFASFLKQNFLVTRHDVTIEHLEDQIQKMQMMPKTNASKLREYEEHLAKYKQEVERIDKLAEKETEFVSSESINETLNKLYNLPKNGKSILAMVENTRYGVRIAEGKGKGPNSKNESSWSLTVAHVLDGRDQLISSLASKFGRLAKSLAV